MSDPQERISAANKFLADAVRYVIGHFNLGVTIPDSEVYAGNGFRLSTRSYRAWSVEHVRQTAQRMSR
ncbi:hypothetical protein X762_12250 [Mesorhizobium sp. LSHC426A00]|nr:hypothetical protein X762_12250 [Mesorhizobium sp. LSHC426A00]ESX56256.1 hypothetical protein X761_12730 [Mesorhizobium sp. LSHC424B00]ESX73103.1 hypothetical protein X758_12060 [Mesorhizobium sp. LSHC416B00]